MVTSRSSRGNGSTAVCFSGLVRRSIPANGSLARRHLVDALQADVFLAGTYIPEDCESRQAPPCLRALRARVAGLKPFTGSIFHPMRTLVQLRQSMEATPHFAAVKAAYNNQENWNGLNWFAPVLGNDGLSVLRELHDYSRSYAQVVAHERSRGANYTWLVFARLEMVWLAPHAPLSLLDQRLVWVPPRSDPGVNDRHAVVPRQHAATYFQRWEMLQAPDLLELLPLEGLNRDDPERMLENVMLARGVRVGVLPIAAFLACCTDADRCWAPNCRHEPLGVISSCHDALGLDRIGAAFGRDTPRLALDDGWGVHDSGSGSCVAAGKSGGEVTEAVRNWRWLQCAGAALVPSGLGGLSGADTVRMAVDRPWAANSRRPKPSPRPVYAAYVTISVPETAPATSSPSAPAAHAVGVADTHGQRRAGRGRGNHTRPTVSYELVASMLSTVSTSSSPLGALSSWEKLVGESPRGRASTSTAAPLPVTSLLRTQAAAACPISGSLLHWPGSLLYGPAKGVFRSGEPPPLVNARQGYCDFTTANAAGNCDAHGSVRQALPLAGSWGLGLPASPIGSLYDCALACWRYCRACRYVTFSLVHGDCSWYSRCNLNKLNSPNDAAFQSVQVVSRRSRNGDTETEP